MERVIVRTPLFTHKMEKSYDFARKAVRTVLAEGFAPLSGPLLYGQEGLLDFDKATDFAVANMALLAWKAVAQIIVIYPELDNLSIRDQMFNLNVKRPEMERVIVESPYAGDVEANVNYARACARECLEKEEAPFLSHLLYTQPGILKDEVPEERQWGIDAGLTWGEVAQKTVVYQDLGVSNGMRYGIKNAERAGRPIEFRNLGRK